MLCTRLEDMTETMRGKLYRHILHGVSYEQISRSFENDMLPIPTRDLWRRFRGLPEVQRALQSAYADTAWEGHGNPIVQKRTLEEMARDLAMDFKNLTGFHENAPLSEKLGRASAAVKVAAAYTQLITEIQLHYRSMSQHLQLNPDAIVSNLIADQRTKESEAMREVAKRYNLQIDEERQVIILENGETLPLLQSTSLGVDNE